MARLRDRPVIVESCPTRLFLPNERALESQLTAIYRRLGLNDRQIKILSRATPKRDHVENRPGGARLAPDSPLLPLADKVRGVLDDRKQQLA